MHYTTTIVDTYLITFTDRRSVQSNHSRFLAAFMFSFPGVSLFKTIYFAITGTCQFRLGLLIAFAIRLPVGFLSCLPTRSVSADDAILPC